MRQQLQPGQPGNRQNAWLSMLIDTMEKAASAEWRAMPCDRSVLAAVQLQLAQPGWSGLPYASGFSFRN